MNGPNLGFHSQTQKQQSYGQMYAGLCSADGAVTPQDAHTTGAQSGFCRADESIATPHEWDPSP